MGFNTVFDGIWEGYTSNWYHDFEHWASFVFVVALFIFPFLKELLAL